MMSSHSLREWLKTSPSPLARTLFRYAKSLRALDFPAPKAFYSLCYQIYILSKFFLSEILRAIVWTPMLKSRLTSIGKRLYLYGGLPYLAGPLDIAIGDDCRISGQTTITGRTSAPRTPLLQLGNNIDLGWMSTIAVGRRVVLGNNVRIAGQCFLAGYPGHPLDASARAQGMAETDDQVGDIVLKDDVWLATGVFVMAGVTIGEGTVVAAGSVVTGDLPDYVLAAGVPAKIVRRLANANDKSEGSDPQ